MAVMFGPPVYSTRVMLLRASSPVTVSTPSVRTTADSSERPSRGCIAARREALAAEELEGELVKLLRLCISRNSARPAVKLGDYRTAIPATRFSRVGQSAGTEATRQLHV